MVTAKLRRDVPKLSSKNLPNLIYIICVVNLSGALDLNNVKIYDFRREQNFGFAEIFGFLFPYTFF